MFWYFWFSLSPLDQRVCCLWFSKVAAGTDIIKATLNSFCPATMSTRMILDLVTYDAFPALAALEDSNMCSVKNHWKESWQKWKQFVIVCQILASIPYSPTQRRPEEVAAGNRVMCGSVVLNGDPSSLQRRVGNAVYESCRAGHAVLPNFPAYEPVIQALRDNAAPMPTVNYKVCIARADRLLVLQSLARRWTEYEGTKDEAVQLIEAHNKHFNPDGDFMEDDERTQVLQICLAFQQWLALNKWFTRFNICCN